MYPDQPVAGLPGLAHRRSVSRTDEAIARIRTLIQSGALPPGANDLAPWNLIRKDDPRLRALADGYAMIPQMQSANCMHSNSAGSVWLSSACTWNDGYFIWDK